MASALTTISANKAEIFVCRGVARTANIHMFMPRGLIPRSDDQRRVCVVQQFPNLIEESWNFATEAYASEFRIRGLVDKLRHGGYFCDDKAHEGLDIVRFILECEEGR